MKVMKRLIFFFFVILILITSCKKKGPLLVKLPEVEPMGFSIPDEVRDFYEKIHKKGDNEFTYEEFFGEQVRIPRPIFEKETRVKNEKELVDIKTYMGKFKEAEKSLSGFLSKSKNSAKALEFAGRYYIRMNNVDKGIQYLFQSAKKKNKPSALLELINIAREQNLTQKKYEYLNYLTQSFPDSQQFYRTKLEELKNDKRLDELLQELKAFYKIFPQEKRYYLKESQLVLSLMDKEKNAINLYIKEIDPLKDVEATSDFFRFLEDINRLREYRKIWKKKRDKKSMMFLFLAYLHKNSWKEAENVIGEFTQRYPDDTYLVGRLYKILGYPNSAYEFYLKTLSTKGESDKLLFEIFNLLSDGKNGSVSYKNRSPGDVVLSFDKNPGICGGLISLYYNTLDYGKRKSSLERLKGQYINLSFSYELFLYILNRYPKTEKKDSLYSPMMKQFSNYNIYEKVVKLGNEYINKSKGDNYVKVYELIADAYIALEREEEGEKIYRTLLQKLSHDNRMKEYYLVFNRFINILISMKNYELCTKLYWEEIKKHPDEERLYRNFLSFIYNYNLYHEELKVYQYAIKQFDEKTWYHKIARWYIRHRSEYAFRNQTEKIKKIFNDQELIEYLQEFVHFNPRKGFYHPGNQFYLAMYTYGMKKFPDNVAFAKGLIRFYSQAPTKYARELDSLYKSYFFYDKEIREKYIKFLSKNRMLEENLKIAQKKQGVLYHLFTAEAKNFLSRYEEAEKPLRMLTLLYPERLEFALRLANLYRSIDYSYYNESRKLTEQGIGVFLRGIKLFPTTDTLYTQLGEMFVESGRYSEANKHWQKKISIKPGLQRNYLNVATILWDYYDYKKSIGIINKAREVFKNDSLYAKEMAVLYEELNNYEKAIEEYVIAGISGKYFYYDMYDILSRFEYLAREKELNDLIEKTFMNMVKSNEKPDRIVKMYAMYLDRMQKYERKLEMYKTTIPFLCDPYTIREILNELQTTDRANLIINYAKRLVEVTGKKEDYLLLASTYENLKRFSDAKSMYRKLEKMYADETGAKRDILGLYSEFLWRSGDYTASLDVLFEVAKLSSGPSRSSTFHNLAYRAISVDDFERAKIAFDRLLSEDPYNVNYFNLLGNIYQKTGDSGGLEDVYLKKIKNIKKSTLSFQQKKSKLRELYLGLARRMEKMGKETKSQDYYIETINMDPTNVSLLDEVYTFSKKKKMVSRLVEYYRKTAEKSYRDYRWQMVLFRFYLREDKTAAAIEEIKKAVSNQPQKAYLHEKLADILTISGQYDEAIEEYEKAYVLSKEKNEIVKKIALISLRRGDRQKMLKRFDDLIKAKPKGAEKYFDVANICLNYGLLNEALMYARKGERALQSGPYRGGFSDKMLSTMGEVYIRNGKLPELMDFLINQYGTYSRDKEREESYRRNEAITRDSRIRYFISGKLPNICLNYATRKDRVYLSKSFNQYRGFSYDSGIIGGLLNLAKYSEIPQLAEDIVLWKFYEKKKSGRYTSSYEVLNFYSDRGVFQELYNFLEKQGDNYSRLASLSKILENNQELKWLRYYYAEGKDRYRKYYNSFTAYSPLIEKYLEILLKNNLQNELIDIQSQPSVYNGQILNHFYKINDGQRALNLIDNGFPQKNILWKKSKKAFVTLNLGYKTNQGRRYFQDILDIRNIGEKLEKRNQNALSGDDFFINCFFFGKQDSSYLFSLVEASPLNGRNYRKLGNHYYENEAYKSAIEWFNKSIKLNPNNATYVELAKTYLALNDKAKALECLKNLDKDNLYSKENYINSLLSLGFRKQAEKVLTEYLNRKIESLPHGETIRAIELIYKTEEKPEKLLKNLSKKIKKNSYFYSVILQSSSIQDPLFFIERYLKIIESGRAEKNYYKRRDYIEMLSEQGRPKDALQLVTDTEEGVPQDSLPMWFIPAKAEILLKLDREKEAISVLRTYVESKEYIPEHNRILKILKSAGERGLPLRLTVYKKLINNYGSHTSNYLGLAETYLLMDKEQEAVQTLNELVLKTDYSHSSLIESAKLLHRFGKNNSAEKFLGKLLKINPGSNQAKIVRASILCKKGNIQKGCTIVLDIIDGRNERSLKEEAIAILETCGKNGIPLVEERIKNSSCEELYIAKARLLESLGEKGNALSVLRSYMDTYDCYSSRIPLMASELSEGNESISYLYNSLFISASQDRILLKLVPSLMKMKRDNEVKELISKTGLDPSRYINWYDRNEGITQYISNMEVLLKTDKNNNDLHENLFNILSRTANFYERTGDYENNLFVLESLLRLEKSEKLMKRIKVAKEKIEEKEKEERFIIKEDLSNGERI
jgi:tetratricopeptide (TPR) repeat protein